MPTWIVEIEQDTGFGMSSTRHEFEAPTAWRAALCASRAGLLPASDFRLSVRKKQ